MALEKGSRGGRDPYEGYYASSSTGIVGEAITDDRLPGKEFVIGVALDGTAVAYPFRVLSTEPVVNDSIGDYDILVVFDPDDGSGLVYNRNIVDRKLTFEPTPDGKMSDNETGTVWEPLSGKAIEGPLTGEQLERIKSTVSFWFGWKDFYQDTLVYGGGES